MAVLLFRLKIMLKGGFWIIDNIPFGRGMDTGFGGGRGGGISSSDEDESLDESTIGCDFVFFGSSSCLLS